MMELVLQIRKKFAEINSKCFQDLEFLLPQNAVTCRPPSLREVYREWCKQAVKESDTLTSKHRHLEFWRASMSVGSILGELMYPNLQKNSWLLNVFTVC